MYLSLVIYLLLNYRSNDNIDLPRPTTATFACERISSGLFTHLPEFTLEFALRNLVRHGLSPLPPQQQKHSQLSRQVVSNSFLY